MAEKRSNTRMKVLGQICIDLVSGDRATLKRSCQPKRLLGAPSSLAVFKGLAVGRKLLLLVNYQRSRGAILSGELIECRKKALNSPIGEIKSAFSSVRKADCNDQL